MTVTRLLAATALATLALAGCGDDGGRPGEPEVYAEIEAEADCTELQAGFDRNMDDVERREPGDPIRKITLSYAHAYDDRMGEVGCYEGQASTTAAP